jgi:hypothetical protein
MTSPLQYHTPTPRDLADEARDRKDALRYAAWDFINLLTRMIDIGIPRSAAAEALDALLDPLVAADAACNSDIEAIKEWYEPLDLTEAWAMREGLGVPL